jgi:hypothetical protein
MNTSSPNPSLQRKHAARITAVQYFYAGMMDPNASLGHLVAWHQEQKALGDAETKNYCRALWRA